MSDKKDNFISYYNEFKDKIYAYFYYRSGYNQSLAEDLTADVFLKAFQNFDSFDETRSFKSWIYAISHNHLVNYYKIPKRETELTEAEDVGQSEDAMHEVKYELARVMKVIESMEYHDKEVLLLKFVDELTNSEIANILNKEEGAVRTQISRSLAKLRKILNSYE